MGAQWGCARPSLGRGPEKDAQSVGSTERLGVKPQHGAGPFRNRRHH